MNDKQNKSEVIDLEEYAAAGKEVPAGKKYQIRVDKQHFTVERTEMKGREILGLANKNPEKFLLRQKSKGGVAEIGPDQIVNFLTPGIERFMTIPNEVQEGEPAPPRMHFNPLPADVDYLNRLGLRWEAVIEGGLKVVAIYQWPLPEGYNVPAADVHVRLLNGYPDTQIDMAYFAPSLSRADGKSVNGLSLASFDGRQWQQWSRHRTENSKWRIGEDDLSTHMALVRNWLVAELSK